MTYKIPKRSLTSSRERWKARRSLMRDANVNLDICESLRLVYDLVYKIRGNKKLKEEIRERLVDSTILGRKITDRLWYYKETYQDKTGKAGSSLIQLPEAKKRKEMRRNRK